MKDFLSQFRVSQMDTSQFTLLMFLLYLFTYMLLLEYRNKVTIRRIILFAKNLSVFIIIISLMQAIELSDYFLFNIQREPLYVNDTPLRIVVKCRDLLDNSPSRIDIYNFNTDKIGEILNFFTFPRVFFAFLITVGRAAIFKIIDFKE